MFSGPTSRVVGRLKEEKEENDDEIAAAALPISTPDSDRPF